MQKNELMGDLLNIWIVAHGGREACLIESTNYEDTFDENWKILKSFATELDLHIRKDPNSLKKYPRYLISKDVVKGNFNHSQLGKMLGFAYLKSDYSNSRYPRTVFRIFAVSPEWKEDEDLNIWVEVSRNADLSKANAESMVEIWNTILQLFPFPYLSNIRVYLVMEKDEGWQTRLDNIGNDVYFLEKYDDYSNDVYNYAPNEEWIEVMDIIPTTPEELAIRKQIWLESMEDEM